MKKVNLTPKTITVDDIFETYCAHVEKNITKERYPHGVSACALIHRAYRPVRSSAPMDYATLHLNLLGSRSLAYVVLLARDVTSDDESWQIRYECPPPISELSWFDRVLTDLTKQHARLVLTTEKKKAHIEALTQGDAHDQTQEDVLAIAKHICSYLRGGSVEDLNSARVHLDSLIAIEEGKRATCR